MKTQQLVFGFFVLLVFNNCKVHMFPRKGKSFVGNADASGATYTMHDSVNAAIDAARVWSVYMWNNNDRRGLVQEYGLTREDVTDFMNYTWSEDYR